LLDFLYFYNNDEIAENDNEDAANELGCEVNAIKAVAILETEGPGSYYSHNKNDTVPAILYERHVFYRNTKNPKKSSWMLKSPSIVHKSQSDSYGLYSQQYEELIKAYALD